jgi:glycosidase
MAINFAMTARDIPFFYYGNEYGFSGGNDPACCEPILNAMETQADIY